MIEAVQTDLLNQVNRLLQAEDPDLDIFFAEQIHALRQERAMLAIQLDYRQMRLKRLRDQGEA